MPKVRNKTGRDHRAQMNKEINGVARRRPAVSQAQREIDKRQGIQLFDFHLLGESASMNLQVDVGYKEPLPPTGEPVAASPIVFDMDAVAEQVSANFPKNFRAYMLLPPGVKIERPKDSIDELLDHELGDDKSSKSETTSTPEKDSIDELLDFELGDDKPSRSEITSIPEAVQSDASEVHQLLFNPKILDDFVKRRLAEQAFNATPFADIANLPDDEKDLIATVGDDLFDGLDL